MSTPEPTSTLVPWVLATPCQSRLYPAVRDSGFGLSNLKGRKLVGYPDIILLIPHFIVLETSGLLHFTEVVYFYNQWQRPLVIFSLKYILNSPPKNAGRQ